MCAWILARWGKSYDLICLTGVCCFFLQSSHALLERLDYQRDLQIIQNARHAQLEDIVIPQGWPQHQDLVSAGSTVLQMQLTLPQVYELAMKCNCHADMNSKWKFTVLQIFLPAFMIILYETVKIG